MIDFACKRFRMDDIIKCGLGLTRTEHKIFEHFVENDETEFTTKQMANSLNLNLTTVQKAVKKLTEHKVILRHQINLENGGYMFTYQAIPKPEIREILKNLIRNWESEVEKHIDRW